MSTKMHQIEAAVEAVLFSVGDAVSMKSLSEALGIDMKTFKQIIRQMKERYEDDDRGIQLIELEDQIQLCSKPEHYDLIRTLVVDVKEAHLTDVLIETLAIVAYQQPVTKASIEAVRGVNSNHVVNRLVEYGLLEEVGRMQAPGRPILFGTTQHFLRAFGLSSVEEMPRLDVSSGQMHLDET